MYYSFILLLLVILSLPINWSFRKLQKMSLLRHYFKGTKINLKVNLRMENEIKKSLFPF
jgi:hypothetical protein